MEERVCGTCGHYIGGGDWNLCCDMKYDLCYQSTPACENYEFSRETSKRLEERYRMLNESMGIKD